MTFDSLGLSTEILDAVAKRGYQHPTPIQARAIPVLLEGHDVMGRAQTGTGKTAAFTIPILEKLRRNNGSGKLPRALILVPTRELAAQVAESVRTYGAFLPLRSMEIFGGVGINPQIDQLQKGVDIVIATPGRLLDLLGQRAISLKKIEILVLDEADRMLDMGFIRDIKKILGFLPGDRQNMLFSATFSKEIKKLAQQFLREPVSVEITPQNTAAETVEQIVHPVARENKTSLLAHLIREGNWYQVLIFTKTKRRAQSLSRQLQKKNIPSLSIHGDKSQNARTRALKEFKSGKIQALVATDIAARGIDVTQLSHVVNYQLPQTADDYIHRIGRTGRAGEAGTAVSLICEEDREMLGNVEKLLKRRIRVVPVEGFSESGPRLESGTDRRPGDRNSGKRTNPGAAPNREGSRHRNDDRRSQRSGAAPEGNRSAGKPRNQRRRQSTRNNYGEGRR